MGENAKKQLRVEEVIEAFDRQRAEAQEHNRRHTEWVRMSRQHDRPAADERQREQHQREQQ